MLKQIKQDIWQHFGASIDALQDAIKLCPEELMLQQKRVFYIMYHTLVFLDYYITIPPHEFNPVLPYSFANTEELPAEAIDDLMPDKQYSKEELLSYLQVSRSKAKLLIHDLTEEKIIHQRFRENFETDAMDYSIIAIILYNMRHVQHHTAQLNLMLRQHINQSSNWVFKAND